MENKRRSAEKDLKNIRKLLGNSTKEFANRLGMSEIELKKYEKEEKQLTDGQLIVICSIILNTIEKLTSITTTNQINNSNDREKVDNTRKVIIQKLSEYVSKHHPFNHQNNQVLNGKVSIIKADEPINLTGYKVRKKSI